MHLTPSTSCVGCDVTDRRSGGRQGRGMQRATGTHARARADARINQGHRHAGRWQQRARGARTTTTQTQGKGQGHGQTAKGTQALTGDGGRTFTRCSPLTRCLVTPLKATHVTPLESTHVGTCRYAYTSHAILISSYPLGCHHSTFPACRFVLIPCTQRIGHEASSLC